MLCYTLYTQFLLVILHTLSISMAQKHNNHPLLPNLNECGKLNLEEFEDRTGMVQPNEFPWMAQVTYTDNRITYLSYSCSAVLINQRYLLAAAHCIEDKGQDEVNSVLLGVYTNTSDETEVPKQMAVEEIVVHPYFNLRERANNIALLRLNKTISYTNNIRPICLPDSNVKDKEFGGEQLIVAGWYVREDPRNIHKLPVVINNMLDCRRKYSRLININDSHMCGITCFQRTQYRSGSALMDTIDNTNYYLAGLLSGWRSICKYPEEADIFTRVDRYMDWITANIYA